MLRALALATLVLAAPVDVLVQAPSVLHIRVTVLDAERGPIPVARHTLLISANPATAAPRRTITSLEGTVDVSLLPGSYIVESDRPAAVGGRSYQWTQVVEITASRETTLELTAGNALVGAVTPEMTTQATTVEAGASSILTRWQDSVVTLWTARARASGFLVNATGLVATSQRAIGDATSVEVEVTAAVKVAAKVLAADAARDVAILWINPAAVAGMRPVPLACEPASSVADGRELFAIDVPLRGPKSVTSVASSDTAGGPVFTADGTAIGLMSASDAADERRRGETTVVAAVAVCEALASAQTKMSGSTPPDGTHLPVESARAVRMAALKAAAAGRAFTLNPYRISSSDFDIVFITPVLLAGAESQQGRTIARDDGSALRAVTDFGDWSDYMAEAPPVLLVRVTPRLVEGLWLKVARGAASTQGVSLPPIKRLRPGFSQMRVLCGGREITPIHPFKIQQRVSETDAIDEGFYVFDPAAIGPNCGEVTLVLSSVKEPDRAETRVVDPAVIRRISQDFAALPSQP